MISILQGIERWPRGWDVPYASPPCQASLAGKIIMAMTVILPIAAPRCSSSDTFGSMNAPSGQLRGGGSSKISPLSTSPADGDGVQISKTSLRRGVHEMTSANGGREVASVFDSGWLWCHVPRNGSGDSPGSRHGLAWSPAWDIGRPICVCVALAPLRRVNKISFLA
jgi:hypothetical protein